MYRIIGADGKEYGPVSDGQIRQWVAEGRANAQTQVRAEAGSQWQRLGSLPEFGALFFPPAGAVPPPYSPGFAPPLRKTNSLAVIGLILGALSFCGCACCCCGIPIGPLGIVFSLLALSQINADPEHQHGRSLAIAGLVLSSLAILASLGWMGYGFLTNPHQFRWQFHHF